MTTERATRRYFMLFAPAMIIFMVSSLGIVWAEDNTSLPQPAFYVLTAIPVVALLSTFWAQWRFVTEIDEFLRLIQLKAIIAGLAVAMVVATGWGTMEQYANAPELRIFWLNPIFWASYGITALIITKREGGIY